MELQSKIFVAGHRGLVGSAIHRRLERGGFGNLVLRSSSELDLRDSAAVDRFFATEKPEYVILAAARVGGIHANNSRPADFIRDNLLIQTNRDRCRVALRGHASCCSSVRAAFTQSLATQPIRESEYLLTGAARAHERALRDREDRGSQDVPGLPPPVRTSMPSSAMPTNLYGPGDNFDLQNSHVLPALLRKVHEAKLAGQGEVSVWGTGTPRREFLHVDDLADACVHLIQKYSDEGTVNVGWGEDVSIAELAVAVAGVVGYAGRFVYDASKPDGTPRKLLDTSKLTALGWKPSIRLDEGLRSTYRWYLEQTAVRQ